MDLLDRLLGHDVWTTRVLLDLCHQLTDEQLDRDFDIAHRTVRATFIHMIANLEIWTDLMNGKPMRQERGRSIPELIERLDRAAADLSTLSRDIARRDAWDERFVDVLDNPPREKSFGGAIAHVITHNMHHRAQLLYMMRRLGVHGLPEGDVLSWEQQLTGGK
jgi:uncharacterized damage-inducible protein DinB